MSTSAPARSGKRSVNFKVLVGSLSGSSIEWFDFFLYATAAALIFDKQFFPTDDPFVSLMLSYFTLSLTFFVRPFGGIIFSHIGDKIGRKKTLVVTLSMMGGATVAIGFLPTYGAVGMLAPALLIVCRIVQGLAIGGEWGGALLLAYEYAPKHRRGFFGSVPQMGITVGMLLATLAFGAVSALPNVAFETWGWRLPFIASIILVVIGLWIRLGLDETPAFKKAQETGNVSKLPIADTLRFHWRAVLVAIGVKVVETAPFYIFAVFVVSYSTGLLGYERSTILNSVSAGALISTIMIPLMGILSDKVGRFKVYLSGAILIALFSAPFFLLLDLQANWAAFAAVIIGLAVVWPPVTATLGTLTAEIFSTKVRYTGVTLGYQIGAALAGGTAPLLATFLLNAFGGSWVPVAGYILLVATISIIAVSFSPGIARQEAAKAEAIDAEAAASHSDPEAGVR